MLRLNQAPRTAKLLLIMALAASTLVATLPAEARGPGGGPGGPGPGWGGPPPAHSRLFFRGEPYYFHGGRYYRPWLGGFVPVFPPVGLVVGALPIGFTMVVLAGITYYLYDGVYYQPAPGGYVVVTPPAVAQVVPVTPSGVVAPAQSADGAAAVTAPQLNVRSGPGLAYPVLVVINQGEMLTLQGRTGTWLLVRTQNGIVGWVAQEFTTMSTPPASG